MNEPLVPLPDVHEAMLSPDQESQLFTDVSTVSEFLSATLKGAPRTHTSESELTLAAALSQWKSGAARGMQLRYRYQGIEWWDTLLRTPAGTRLVRIGHRWEQSAQS